jgi:hypothetical protein
VDTIAIRISGRAATSDPPARSRAGAQEIERETEALIELDIDFA